MSPSLESLRAFVVERLTDAAEEIFRVFQQRIDEYEDKLDCQRRLVESVWRPEIRLHRIGRSVGFRVMNDGKPLPYSVIKIK